MFGSLCAFLPSGNVTWYFMPLGFANTSPLPTIFLLPPYRLGGAGGGVYFSHPSRQFKHHCLPLFPRPSWNYILSCLSYLKLLHRLHFISWLFFRRLFSFIECELIESRNCILSVSVSQHITQYLVQNR